MYFLTDFCRLCFSFQGEFNNIFNDNIIMDKITACLNDLEFDERIPALICDKCLEQLELFSEFRNRCIQSEFLLNRYVDKLKSSNNNEQRFFFRKLQVNVLQNFASSQKHISNVNVNNTHDNIDTESIEIKPPSFLNISSDVLQNSIFSDDEDDVFFEDEDDDCVILSDEGNNAIISNKNNCFDEHAEYINFNKRKLDTLENYNHKKHKLDSRNEDDQINKIHSDGFKEIDELHDIQMSITERVKLRKRKVQLHPPENSKSISLEQTNNEGQDIELQIYSQENQEVLECTNIETLQNKDEFHFQAENVNERTLPEHHQIRLRDNSELIPEPFREEPHRNILIDSIFGNIKPKLYEDEVNCSKCSTEMEYIQNYKKNLFIYGENEGFMNTSNLIDKIIDLNTEFIQLRRRLLNLLINHQLTSNYHIMKISLIIDSIINSFKSILKENFGGTREFQNFNLDFDVSIQENIVEEDDLILNDFQGKKKQEAEMNAIKYQHSLLGEQCKATTPANSTVTNKVTPNKSTVVSDLNESSALTDFENNLAAHIVFNKNLISNAPPPKEPVITPNSKRTTVKKLKDNGKNRSSKYSIYSSDKSCDNNQNKFLAATDNSNIICGSANQPVYYQTVDNIIQNEIPTLQSILRATDTVVHSTIHKDALILDRNYDKNQTHPSVLESLLVTNSLKSTYYNSSHTSPHEYHIIKAIRFEHNYAKPFNAEQELVPTRSILKANLLPENAFVALGVLTPIMPVRDTFRNNLNQTPTMISSVCSFPTDFHSSQPIRNYSSDAEGNRVFYQPLIEENIDLLQENPYVSIQNMRYDNFDFGKRFLEDPSNIQTVDLTNTSLTDPASSSLYYPISSSLLDPTNASIMDPTSTSFIDPASISSINPRSTSFIDLASTSGVDSTGISSIEPWENNMRLEQIVETTKHKTRRKRMNFRFDDPLNILIPRKSKKFRITTTKKKEQRERKKERKKTKNLCRKKRSGLPRQNSHSFKKGQIKSNKHHTFHHVYETNELELLEDEKSEDFEIDVETVSEDELDVETFSPYFRRNQEEELSFERNHKERVRRQHLRSLTSMLYNAVGGANTFPSNASVHSIVIAARDLIQKLEKEHSNKKSEYDFLLLAQKELQRRLHSLTEDNT